MEFQINFIEIKLIQNEIKKYKANYMPTPYCKKKICGCIVLALATRPFPSDGTMYMLGGHIHLKMCDNCKILEDNGEDTLYDMWMDDNITNEFGYAGWEKYDS